MEHKNYLRLEEEKRAKARVVKQAIAGPVLRWISKKETIQVEVQLPPLPLAPTTTATNANLYAAKYSFVYTSSNMGEGTMGSQAYSMPFYAYMPPIAQNIASKPQQTGASASASVTTTPSSSRNPAVASAGASATSTSTVAQATPSLPTPSSSNVQDPATSTTGVAPSVPSTPSWQQQPQPQAQPQSQALVQPQTQIPPVLFSYPPAPAPTAPIIAHRAEDVCKNYVVHELSQSVPSKPPWKDTMSAMFGNHVKWDEVKVFTGKGRPLGECFRMSFFALVYPGVSF